MTSLVAIATDCLYDDAIQSLPHKLANCNGIYKCAFQLDNDGFSNAQGLKIQQNYEIRRQN